MPKVLWEELTGNGPTILIRLSVPGGWLVATSKEPNANLVFVPDRDHDWLSPSYTKQNSGYSRNSNYSDPPF